jgi:hypothetical protein
MANEEDDMAAKVAAVMRALLPQITQLVIAESPHPPAPTDARMPNASTPYSQHAFPQITPSPHLPYHQSPTPSIPNLNFDDATSFDATTPIHTLNQTADPSPAITELRTHLKQVTLLSPYYPPLGTLPAVTPPSPYYHRAAGHHLPKIVWPTRSIIAPIRFVHKKCRTGIQLPDFRRRISTHTPSPGSPTSPKIGVPNKVDPCTMR